MKRINNLFDKVVSYKNLLAASRLAMKGCGKTASTSRFFFDMETEILRLQEELTCGCYQPGAYRYFTIFDPKKRIIAVAPFRDSVVHHAVVRILTPVYERVFIHDSYATRPGKGTHDAILRAQQFTRRRHWYLKADITGYFENVNHNRLSTILKRKIKDRQLLDLLDRIIRNVPSDRGLPIGNLTSQFLANVYLDPLDHEIKDKLGIKCYLRYMDDFVLFGYSKEKLTGLKTDVEQFLNKRLELSLKFKSTWLNRSNHGLSFLGMRIFPRFIRIKPENRKRSLKRMAKKINAWKNETIDDEELAQSMASIVGHLRYFCPGVRISLEADAG